MATHFKSRLCVRRRSVSTSPAGNEQDFCWGTPYVIHCLAQPSEFTNKATSPLLMPPPTPPQPPPLDKVSWGAGRLVGPRAECQKITPRLTSCHGMSNWLICLKKVSLIWVTFLLSWMFHRNDLLSILIQEDGGGGGLGWQSTQDNSTVLYVWKEGVFAHQLNLKSHEFIRFREPASNHH